MGEVVRFPGTEEEKKLTPEMEAYWWRRLEVSQRAAEYAMRELGILKPEKGLEENE